MIGRVGVVARREFLSTVRRRSYLIVTFGMPLFALVYFALLAIVPAYIMAREGGAEIGLVDEAAVLPDRPADPPAAGASADLPGGSVGARGGGVTSALPGGPAGMILQKMLAPSQFRKFADRAAAIAALRDGTIERFFLVPSDYLARGGIESYESEGAPAGLGETRGQDDLERLLSESLLAGRLPHDLDRRVREPIDEEQQKSYMLHADGRLEIVRPEERTARMIIPAAFGIVLLLALMTNAGYLLQGMTEEKENRVVEVILTSVRPRQLLLGKLLGLGSAGLLQLLIWCAVAGSAGVVFAARSLETLHPSIFIGCLLFFVLGFLMVGSLMIGTGALGTNSRESQQLAMIWSLAVSLPPLVTWLVLIREPNGLLARALGWFPPTAPVTMMVRLGTGLVPLWDVGVALLSLGVGVAITIRLASGLLSLGLLSYGRRPTLREVARHLRGV